MGSEMCIRDSLWHRKSCPRFGGSTILPSVISEFFDKIRFHAVVGSRVFLLAARGLSWPHFGCSWLLLGVSWGSLGLLWMRLRPSSPPIRRSGVLKNVAQTTFAIQTSNSRKCYYSHRNIVIFDARRAGLGAQNPFEEGSQGVKRPVR